MRLSFFAFAFALLLSGRVFALGNCSTGLIQRMHLSCICDAVQKRTTAAPSPVWLAALAMSIQDQEALKLDFQPVDPLDKEEKREDEAGEKDGQMARLDLFHRRMAEKIQAFGTCFTQQLDDSGAPDPKKTTFRVLSDRDERDALLCGTGQTPLRGETCKDLAETIGFENQSSLFEFLNPKDWRHLTSNDRRKHWSESERLNQAIEGKKFRRSRGHGLKECLSQIQTLQTKIDAFDTKNDDNKIFCYSMADSCHIPNDFCNAPDPRDTSAPRGQRSPPATPGSVFDKQRRR